MIVKIKPKQACRSTQKCLQQLATDFLKIYYLMEFSTGWSTNKFSVTWQWLRLWAWLFHCSMLLQPERCLLAYCSTHSGFLMDLPVSSFVLCQQPNTCQFGGGMWWLPFTMETACIFHSDYLFIYLIYWTGRHMSDMSSPKRIHCIKFYIYNDICYNSC